MNAPADQVRRNVPQLLSATSHVFTVIGVATVLALTTLGAGQASETAVHNASDCLAKAAPVQVTLERVVVVGRRDAGAKSI